MAKSKPKTIFVIHSQPSPELMCLTIFGKSITEVAKDIIENKDGKYDELYV